MAIECCLVFLGLKEILQSVWSAVTGRIASSALDEVRLAWEFREEVEELQKSDPLMNNLMEVALAHEHSEDSRVVGWCQRVKNVSYDAQDVLDELEYEKLRQQLEIQPRWENKVRNFFSAYNLFVFRQIMAHRVRNINQTVVKIEDGRTKLGLPGSQTQMSTIKSLESEETVSFLKNSELVIDRKEEVSSLISLVVSSKNKNERLSFVPVVGMAGLGKTTLAKKVYKEIQERKYFHVTMWLCVSKNLDVLKILKGMLEELKESGNELNCKNSIMSKLRQKLKDKRFLLVLDDLWDQEGYNWNGLKEELWLCNETYGNCVLVTTRSESVAQQMQPNLRDRHYPNTLSDEECWKIIKVRTFGDKPLSPDLQKIGQDIARKCQGLPLLANVLGGTMYHERTRKKWLSIEEEFSKIVQNSVEILPILQLSYDLLPTASLKRCFAYCAIYPEDFTLRKEELIQQWISEGYFQYCGKNKSMVAIGEEHFIYLVASSLIHVEESDEGYETCSMHDAVHELARHISTSELWMYQDEFKDDISNIRLLNMSKKTEMLEKIGTTGMQRLRALFSNTSVCDNAWDFKSLKVLTVSGDDIYGSPIMVERSKQLRYLDLSFTPIRSLSESVIRLYNLQTLICKMCGSLEQLPEDLGNLFHLQYLDVSFTAIETLPKSIGYLSNLHTLRFHSCQYMRKFPEGVESLVGLKHIWFDKSIFFTARIGRLTSLETLRLFEFERCGRCLFLVGTEGQGLEEFRDLNRLKGELSIEGLHHLRNEEEARRGNLGGKSDLRGLRFKWDSARKCANNDEDVLKGLEPPGSLQRLHIWGFMGGKLPDWCSNPTSLPQLVRLELFRTKCDVLLSFAQLPCLEYLSIKYSRIKRIRSTLSERETGTLFPSLETLILRRVEDLEELEEPTSDEITLFPRLENLTIRNCQKLRRLPNAGCMSLLRVDIVDCGIDCLPMWLQRCKALTFLRVRRCPNLKSLLHYLEKLTSLTTLNIHLPQLIAPPLEGLNCLTCLEELEIGPFSEELEEFPFPASVTSPVKVLQIDGWSRLKSLPHPIMQFTCLESLIISSFEGIEDLPEWLDSLSSLSELTITSCDNLKSLPSAAAMRHLKSLTIIDCPYLEKRCREGGPEWPKISHIPRLLI